MKSPPNNYSTALCTVLNEGWWSMTTHARYTESFTSYEMMINAPSPSVVDRPHPTLLEYLFSPAMRQKLNEVPDDRQEAHRSLIDIASLTKPGLVLWATRILFQDTLDAILADRAKAISCAGNQTCARHTSRPLRVAGNT
ncbi:MULTISPECIES: hypothetical protein [Burkholderia]|uniref:hypothetical protein n=1 Tax=Burkholderia TaxID=32008 RepID=UPI0011609804|nr:MULTISPECIES: hypothetical protein [Burkholderia]